MIQEPNHGLVRILRPFSTFSQVYQGLASTTPIMLTEPTDPNDPGGTPLDPNAGKPGYSPYLLRGLPVVKGSRISLWFPIITGTGVGGPFYYTYFVSWRYRNVYDYRQTRQPYHFPVQQAGVPDTSSGTSQDQVIIPAAWESAKYLQAEPTDGAAITDLRPSQITVKDFVSGGAGPQPLLPDSNLGTYQQGLLDPANWNDIATNPIYLPYEIECVGDEMLVGVYRALPDAGTWNFNGGSARDKEFLELFGTTAFGGTPRYVGVYVTNGISAPAP